MAVVRSRSQFRSLAVLLLISATLIVVDRTASGPTNWVRSVSQDAFAGVGSLASSLSPFGDDREVANLKAENEALRTQLQAAQGSLFATQDQRRQLQSLSSLLNLQTPDNLSTIVAEVTASNTSNFNSSIELSKGTSAGLRVGMPVMTGAGLVGKIVSISGSRSTVLLITDSTSEVGVRFGSTGEVAVAVGQGQRQALRGDLIDLNSKVAPGDVAVTNGQMGSRFPAGIPVATLQTSDATNQDLRRAVTLNPTADLAHLDAVAVVLWTPSS